MPTIDKICTKCQIKKVITCFKYRSDRSTYTSQCIDCINNYRRINYNQNIEHYREYKKTWKNKIGVNKIYKYNYKFYLAWVKNNPEKFRKICSKMYKKHVDNLSNKYLKDLISDCGRSGLKPKEIPQWLIEMKRKQLLLTRQIKNNGKNN
jgi:hypothetical protein